DAAAPKSRCLSLEEASLGEGRLTGERTEQETQRVRRLFSNHHGVIFFLNHFYGVHLHILKPPQILIYTKAARKFLRVPFSYAFRLYFLQ
ncbi:MAG: hypothetical protein U0M62_06235, partial [Lachnospiraceae bacterium]